MSPTVGPRAAPRLPDEYRVLSRFERKIAGALSLAILPPGGPIGPSGEDVGISRFIDFYLSEIPVQLRVGLRAFMILFEFLPFLFIFRFSRFSRLNEADRDRYLDVWQYHRIFWIRAAMLALKSVCCLGYFADERVREDMGFYVVCVDGKRREDI